MHTDEVLLSYLRHGQNDLIEFLRWRFAIDMCSSGDVGVGNLATIGFHRCDVVTKVTPAW